MYCVLLVSSSRIKHRSKYFTAYAGLHQPDARFPKQRDWLISGWKRLQRFVCLRWRAQHKKHWWEDMDRENTKAVGFPRWPEETGPLHRSDERRRLQTEVPSGGADVLLSSGFIAGNSSTSWERTFTKERRFISSCRSQANKRSSTWTGEGTASLDVAPL